MATFIKPEAIKDGSITAGKVSSGFLDSFFNQGGGDTYDLTSGNKWSRLHSNSAFVTNLAANSNFAMSLATNISRQPGLWSGMHSRISGVELSMLADRMVSNVGTGYLSALASRLAPYLEKFFVTKSNTSE